MTSFTKTMLGAVLVCAPLWAQAEYRAEFLETTKAWGSVVADFNRDGHDDVFVTGHHSEDRIWYWTPNGYVPATQVFDWVDRHDCDAADFNQDGLLDMYCTVGADHGTGTGPKELWLQDETGFFQRSVEHGAQDPYGRGRLPVFFDFNHDSYPDLYLTNLSTDRPDGQPNHNRIYINDHGTRFVEVVDTRATGKQGSQCVGRGDVNHDGWDDLIVCNEHGPGHIFLNNQAGDFIELTGPAMTREWWDAKLNDVNGDGLDDLVVINDRNFLQVWINSGKGGFFETPTFESQLGYRAVSLAIADVDLDGFKDIYVVLDDSACLTTAVDLAPDLLFQGRAGNRWVKSRLSQQNYAGCGHLADVVDGHKILLENGNVGLRGPNYVLSFAPAALAATETVHAEPAEPAGP